MTAALVEQAATGTTSTDLLPPTAVCNLKVVCPTLPFRATKSQVLEARLWPPIPRATRSLRPTRALAKLAESDSSALPSLPCSIPKPAPTERTRQRNPLPAGPSLRRCCYSQCPAPLLGTSFPSPSMSVPRATEPEPVTCTRLPKSQTTQSITFLSQPARIR